MPFFSTRVFSLPTFFTSFFSDYGAIDGMDRDVYMATQGRRIRTILSHCPNLHSLFIRAEGLPEDVPLSQSLIPAGSYWPHLTHLSLDVPRLPEVMCDVLNAHATQLQYLHTDFRAALRWPDNFAYDFPKLQQFECIPPSTSLLGSAPQLRIFQSRNVGGSPGFYRPYDPPTEYPDIPFDAFFHTMTTSPISSLTIIEISFCSIGGRSPQDDSDNPFIPSDQHLIRGLVDACPEIVVLDVSGYDTGLLNWPNTWTAPDHDEADIYRVCDLISGGLHNLQVLAYHHAQRNRRSGNEKYPPVEKKWLKRLVGCSNLVRCTFGTQAF